MIVSENGKGYDYGDTFHDFSSDNFPILVFGNYVGLYKPLYLLILNVLRQVVVLVVQLSLGYWSIKTIILTSFDKPITVELLQLLCFIFGAAALQATKFITGDSLNVAMRMLQDGLCKYEGMLDDQRAIMESRVKQIRFYIFIFKILTVCCINTVIVVVPVLRMMFTENDLPYEGINRYLPLPISMPFSTASWGGFLMAYVSHAVCYTFILVTFVCHVQTTSSTSLQLCGEYEVLNRSLENIEKRAHYKLLKSFGNSKISISETLYDRKEFQKCLLTCLRENVLHHHQILSLKKAMSPYLEISLFTILLYLSVVIAAAIILIIEDFINNIALVMFLLSDAIGFLQICWVGQLITNKSDETRLSVFSIPWYNCEKDFCQMLKIMLINVQEPISFKDSGFHIHLSLETYGDMMSLGYKMVNLLR